MPRTLAGLVAELLRIKGWEPSYLTYKSDLSASTVDAIMAGRRGKNPQPKTIAELSKAFEVSADFILAELGHKDHVLSSGRESNADMLPEICELQELISNMPESRRWIGRALVMTTLDHLRAILPRIHTMEELPELRLVAEERAQYTEEEEDGATDHNDSLSDP